MDNLFVGLAVLLLGADQLLRSAKRLSLLFGVSPLVVGLTVVALCTSAPELGISLSAAANDQIELALGNVLGSNIFNTLVILGGASVIRALVVKQHLIRLDIPVLIAANALIWLLAANGRLSYWEAGGLLVCGLGYLLISVLQRENAFISALGKTSSSDGRRWAWRALQMVLGLVCLVLGSNWTVQGANTLIVSLGLDAMTMGLLLVAVASSLPELITSLLAAWRQEGEIAVGTVLGSNILNLLLVLGGAGLIHGQDMGVPGCALRFDLPVMAGLSLACLPVFFSGGAITRLQGLFFLLSYLGYAALVLGMSCGWLAVNPKQLAGMFLFAFLSGVLLASIRWLERRITSSLQALAFEAETSLRASWHQLRKLVVLIVGAATLLAGIALLVLPGPAFVVIPLGLALLGTEFVWARRLLSMMQKRVHKTFKRFSGPGSD